MSFVIVSLLLLLINSSCNPFIFICQYYGNFPSIAVVTYLPEALQPKGPSSDVDTGGGRRGGMNKFRSENGNGQWEEFVYLLVKGEGMEWIGLENQKDDDGEI